MRRNNDAITAEAGRRDERITTSATEAPESVTVSEEYLIIAIESDEKDCQGSDRLRKERENDVKSTRRQVLHRETEGMVVHRGARTLKRPMRNRWTPLVSVRRTSDDQAVWTGCR